MFPKEITDKVETNGGEFGWKFDDIPPVVKYAKKNGIAIIGGQVQYLLPSATCELYWRSADTDPRSPNESWNEYVKKSCDQFMSLFSANIVSKREEIEKDAVQSFSEIKEALNRGRKLSDYEYFVLYTATQKRYKQLLANR